MSRKSNISLWRDAVNRVNGCLMVRGEQVDPPKNNDSKNTLDVSG